MIQIGSKVRVHSREEIAAYVEEAADILDHSTVGSEHMAAIFPQVLALVSQHQIEVEQTQMVAGPELGHLLDRRGR